MKSLVMCSGGLDSTVLLYWTRKYFDDKPLVLNFNYGQKNYYEESQALKKICKELKLKYKVLDVKSLFANDKSHLIREGVLDNTKDTTVGLRNGVLINIASHEALQHDINFVMFAGFTSDYHDTSRNFSLAVSSEVLEGTNGFVRVLAPFSLLDDKADVITTGKHLDVPMNLTWSCYDSKQHHCGVCQACEGRKKGFLDAGIEDRTRYMN